jgi:HSP20 family protein
MAIRKRYPFDTFWDEFDQIMADMENRIQSMLVSTASPTRVYSRMIPVLRGEFRVDVREHDDEIIVVADLPGIDKEDIELRLVNPTTLELSCERKGEKEEEEEGYYMRERIYGSLRRLISLPAGVTEVGTSATFKNGVLEVKLKKSAPKKGMEIQIE